MCVNRFAFHTLHPSSMLCSIKPMWHSFMGSKIHLLVEKAIFSHSHLLSRNQDIKTGSAFCSVLCLDAFSHTFLGSGIFKMRTSFIFRQERIAKEAEAVTCGNYYGIHMGSLLTKICIDCRGTDNSIIIIIMQSQKETRMIDCYCSWSRVRRTLEQRFRP